MAARGFQYPGWSSDKLVLQSDSRHFPRSSAFLLKRASIYTVRRSRGVIEIGGNRSWDVSLPRLGRDGAQRKFYYGAPLSTSLDTTLFIIRGY